MSRKIKLASDPFFYLFVFFVIAILAARSYVYFGGDLNLSISGVVIHHYMFGIILMMISGVCIFFLDSRFISSNKLRIFFASIFGAGLGLVTDEISFIFSAASFYSLVQYYSAAGLMAEAVILVIITILFILTTIRRKAKP
ncbi:MAG: hypothetical protein QXJ12_00280 [Candidatus Parvarchaeota archaeon]|nr:hypothetical protein [Candidatus Parvarchaeota archaeon]